MALRQRSLFATPDQVSITVKSSHDMVVLTKLINWDQLIRIASLAREKRVKKLVGPEPRYRPLLGAVALMALRKIGFRQAEDLIAHYAPARYLCDLMECDWTLDHVTIFDFTKMLGDEGLSAINGEILRVAQTHGLLDPSVLMADTTAQEAKIPYPTEVGLMSRYTSLAAKNLRKLGGKFLPMRGKIKETVKKVKGLVRNAHLFAKTTEQKRKIARKLYHVVNAFHGQIKGALKTGHTLSSKAGSEISRLTEVMSALLPQMLHYLKTGFVANGKIIHLQMSELYSMVKGKAGKSAEFGLKWGINRLGGGFLTGYLYKDGQHVSDTKFCHHAIEQHLQMFSEAPKIFGFDRGGYSKTNINRVKKLGVKHVGIAPKGKADWDVSETMSKRIRRERAQVEGSIGTIKSAKYGFNKPDARSIPAMARCGQRAILGFNLQKLIKETIKIQVSQMAN